MTSRPIIYGTYVSPSVHTVLITLKALQIDYEFRVVKPLKKENQTKDYLLKNPSGTIPTLETEDNKCIGNSHAIMAYLVDRYAPNSTLYPKDLYARARINQLLHFSDSVLFTSCIKPAFAPIFARLATTVPEEILLRFDEAFAILERFLTQNIWLAGDQITIADFACVSTVSGMFYFRPISKKSHPKLSSWFESIMQIPHVYETFAGEAMSSTHTFLSKYISKL